MDMVECALCGKELDETRILFKGMMFCSEECRKEWAQDLGEEEEFDLEALDDPEDPVEDILLEDDLLDDDLLDDPLDEDIDDDLF